jgi:hypothetical protein
MISIGGPPATKIFAAACLTGEGTARCVKELLDTWLQPYPDIEVRAVDLDGTPQTAGARLAALTAKAARRRRRQRRPRHRRHTLHPPRRNPRRRRQTAPRRHPRPRTPHRRRLGHPRTRHLLAQYLRFLEPRRMIALSGGILKHIETGLGRPLLPHQSSTSPSTSAAGRAQPHRAGRSFWPREAEIRRANPAVWQLVQQAVKPLEAEFAVTAFPPKSPSSPTISQPYNKHKLPARSPRTAPVLFICINPYWHPSCS